MKKIIIILLSVLIILFFSSCETNTTVYDYTTEAYKEFHTIETHNFETITFPSIDWSEFELKTTTHPPTTTQQKYVYMVYITDYGTKYHRYYCGSLWESCHEISYEEAIASGYTACERCNP